MTKKNKNIDPLTIAAKVGITAKEHNFAIVYPKNNGYSLAIYWWNEESEKHELLTSSSKTYRTKKDCLSIIKKMRRFFGSSDSFAKWFYTYDHTGKEMDTRIKIKYVY